MTSLPEVNENQNIYTSDRMDDPYISIPQFYAGRSVFITGGTGFMGKVIWMTFSRGQHYARWIYFAVSDIGGKIAEIMYGNRANLYIDEAEARTRSRGSPRRFT